MPYPLVLGCDRPLVGVDAENSEVVQKTPHPFLLLFPRGPRNPHEFPEHHALRESRLLHARHKPRKRDPPLPQYRLDALAPHLHEGVEVGDRVVSAIVLSPSDAAGQEAVVGSAQHVVVARTRAPRDAAVQYCLEYFGFQHPDLELEGSARSVVQFERILPEAAPGVAYATVDLNGQVGVVVDIPSEVYGPLCAAIQQEW